MIAIIMLIISTHMHGTWFAFAALVLFYLAAILTIWSMLVYFYMAWRVIVDKNTV
jgi:phosphatidylglycerophosphate synthase